MTTVDDGGGREGGTGRERIANVVVVQRNSTSLLRQQSVVAPDGKARKLIFVVCIHASSNSPCPCSVPGAPDPVWPLGSRCPRSAFPLWSVPSGTNDVSTPFPRARVHTRYVDSAYNDGLTAEHLEGSSNRMCRFFYNADVLQRWWYRVIRSRHHYTCATDLSASRMTLPPGA